jgi:hypothetical protein
VSPRPTAGYLPRLFSCIEQQTLAPAEIVLVDTSIGIATQTWLERWRGAVSIHSWIAFLDCRTYPSLEWLERSLALAALEGAQFLSTLLQCRGDSRLKETLIAATYGCSAVRSLPGSLIERRAFDLVGGFLAVVRAGEDMEWMRRVKESGIKISRANSVLVSYDGFPATLQGTIGKWYGYTLANARIGILNTQKIVYSALCFLFCLLCVYRWNDLFAHWRESSVYYIPNITKIFLAGMAGCYLFHRGLLRPLIRKVPLSFLLP